ncbi:MAG: TIM barrel protein [Chloroflexi bacterium]|nr:TIM barrel protein [Chloroflexota bacterium]
MLHFAVNVSMLWRDIPFVERFQQAKDAGFDTVEFLWPRGENLDEVVSAIKGLGLRVALHNMDSGDMPKGERGYANDPARKAEWREMLQAAVEFSRRVDCTRINCLAGNDLGALPREAQFNVVDENYRWALPIAAASGITLCVEPLNTFDTPRYLWPRTADGLAFLQRIASPWARLQYDVYHMQRMEGRMAETIRQHAPLMANIQIADDPGRHEPGTGQIGWREVFGAIEQSGYHGYVGLEYLARATPEESFRWLPAGRRSECAAAELNLP